MLGHMLVREYQDEHEVVATTRATTPIFHAERPGEIRGILDACRPDAVVNCIGVIKQLKEASDPLKAIPINSMLPHVVNLECRKRDIKFVHISTDCVFSGLKGNYCQSDNPDPTDLYGRSKLLGEVLEHGVTLRTSIIGRELKGRSGLVEWFLSQAGQIRGFSRATYSGFTTREMSRIILMVLNSNISGLYHVSSDPIDKHELLSRMKALWNMDVAIEKDSSFVCDRSLESSPFRNLMSYVPPSWEDMLREMRNDSPYYKEQCK